MCAALRWCAAALVLGLPGVAWADPISVVATLAPYIGGTAAAALATVGSFVAAYGGYALAAYSVYGGIRARRAAKRSAAAARRAYNDSLADRFVTGLRADPPWRVVYGRCITGGDVVAILTSDKTGVRDNGNTYTKPDGYKHLVIALASHRVEAIHEVYIDGEPVGALDGSGWATGGEFGGVTKRYSQTRTIAGGGSVTFPAPVTVLSAGRYVADDWQDVTPSVAGAVVTAPAGEPITVSVSYTLTTGLVRVEKALGLDTQAASVYLQAQCPAEWTAADRLRGIAYIVVTLDLEEARFQGGPPNITADVSGRRVFDPRTSTTAWTRNPALVIRDWLTQPWGFGVDAAEVDDASVIAAANACDTVIDLTVGDVTASGARYTCDGAVTTEAAPEAVLEDLANAMAGWATHTGGLWVVSAGVYTVPVMHLTEDIQAGAVEVVQAGVGYDELYNGVRGQMVEAQRGTPSEFDPYSNTAYVSADGQELWADVVLPWTDSRARARNLARILTEANRESLVVRYPAQLHAWPLQVGDRVQVTSAEYGWTGKVFRVTDWQFAADAPVMLTLQEDDEAIYDLADAATVDQAPNTGLPNPWQVPAVAGLGAASGSAYAQTLADGSVIERVRVTWTAIINAYVTQGGSVLVRWRRVDDADSPWTLVLAQGSDTVAWLTGVRAGDRLTIWAQAQNSLGQLGVASVIGHTVAGKSAAPSQPASLSGSVGQGIITWTWPAPPERDWAETVARLGGSGWASATPFWAGRATSVLQRVTATGTYTLRIKTRNTSGVESASARSASVVVTADDLVQAEPGSPGLGQATAYLYQWATAAPADPSGESTYTWATSAHTAYTGGGGWALAVGANPGTAGIGLWVAAKGITAPAGTSASTVIWDSGYSVYRATVNGGEGPAGAAGAAGAPGIKAATPVVYRWAATIPTAPTGSSTYTWATASYAAPSGWVLTTTGGSPGETLWAARVQIVDAAGAATTSVDWTTSSILAVGYRGNDGAAGATGATGQTGISARRAYVLTTLSSLGAGTVVTTGINSLPPNGSFGASGWGATPSEPAVGQVLYQSDGLYNPATNQVTWYAPYISALKVGNLSAIAVNTGALTVQDTLTIGTTGRIQGGATGYAAGDGIWQGYSGGQYRARWGAAGGARIQWTGSAVEVYNAANVLTFSSGTIIPTNTNQLIDGAGLGNTATWAGVSGIPYETIVSNDDAVALGFNPSFAAWTGTYPAGWENNVGGAAIVKETALVRIGPNAVRFATGGTNRSIRTTAQFDGAPMPEGTFVAGTVDMRIVSVAPGNGTARPGVRVLLYYTSALGSSRFTDAVADIAPAAIGQWQRIPFTARLNAGERIHGIRVVLYAAHTHANYQGLFDGDVVYDNLRLALFDRSTDNQDIQLQGSAGTITITGAGGGSATGVVMPGNPINAGNISTYIASAAIGWAQIGDLVISTGGGIRSGKASYGSGTGWVLEYNGGTPRLDIGGPDAYMRWTGTELQVRGLTTLGPVPTPPPVGSNSLGAVSGTRTASASVETNGTLGRRADAGAWVTVTNWWKPTTAGVGTGRYVRFTLLQAPAATVTVTGSFGSWAQINAQRVVSIQRNYSTFGQDAAVIGYEIASDSGGTNIISSGYIYLNIGYIA